MKSIDRVADETVAFILDHLPSQPARILDIGCGEGRVAARLQALGHAVVAIDEAAELVERARASGVDARLAAWPAFEDQPFDVLLFVRSLHHLHPLSGAVEQAHRLLVPLGRVIVEDFAWDEIGPVTAEWFYGLLRLLSICGVVAPDEDSFAAGLLRSAGEFSFWEQSHEHELHTVPAMWAALRSYFEPLSESRAPDLYRYLCPVLAENDTGYEILSEVFEQEKRMANLGAITMIGHRFVGIKQ